jgi:hypothetical protein
MPQRHEETKPSTKSRLLHLRQVGVRAFRDHASQLLASQRGRSQPSA